MSYISIEVLKKKKWDKLAIIVRDFNIPLSVTGRISRQKINRDIRLKDYQPIWHSKEHSTLLTAGHTFFPSICRTFTKINLTLGLEKDSRHFHVFWL